MNKRERPVKAKDSPWDADLTGSVASTVTANIRSYTKIVSIF